MACSKLLTFKLCTLTNAQLHLHLAIQVVNFIKNTYTQIYTYKHTQHNQSKLIQTDFQFWGSMLTDLILDCIRYMHN